MEKEKIELIKFDEASYFEGADAVFAQRTEVEKIADELNNEGYSNIWLLGIGGTEFELYQFEYNIKKMSNIEIKVINAADCNMIRPRGLTTDSLVITASASGDTPELVECVKDLVADGVRVVAFTKLEGVLGNIATRTIESGVKTAGELELTYVLESYLIYSLVYKRGDFPGYPKFADELKNIFNDLVDIRKVWEPKAENIAKHCWNAPYTIFTGSGALWGETELFAECLLEEMQWVRTRPITSAKFFHGTLELAEPGVPVIIIKGEDEFRKQDNRVEEFCKLINTEYYVLDTQEYKVNVSEEFRPLVVPWIATALLTERLTNWYECFTKHNKKYRRYYRQFNY